MNLAEIKETCKDKKKRKPYLVALLLVVLYAVDIFFISGILGMKFGYVGTMLHELLLAAIAIGVFAVFRGKWKVIFPFKKPEWSKVAGTVILWIGIYLFTMLVTMIVTFFFPEQVMGASEGVGLMVTDMPILIGILVVALCPAICEEIAFRGALLSCFRGAKSKWFGIIVVSLIFGAFHGSIWRMIPTAMLGAAMGYLLFETENMFYNMLFHFINNAMPVLLLGVMNLVMKLLGASDIWETNYGMTDVKLPLASVAMYMIYAGAAPMLIYIGRYLLHRGQPGYDKGVFPADKRNRLVILVGAGIGFMLLGFVLMAIFIGLEAAGAMRIIY